jgi:ribosomal-protein-alanine N-acetyltransferase
MPLDGYTVRRVNEYDGPLLHVIHGDPRVAQWLRPRDNPGVASRQDTNRIARVDAAHWTAHGFGRWVVLDDDGPVGHGGLLLRAVQGQAEVEIAWAVCSNRWGRGIATGIGAVALEHAAEHGLHAPVAFTRVDNLASRRVMEKIGLMREREFPYAGWDHVLYRLPLESGDLT